MKLPLLYHIEEGIFIIDTCRTGQRLLMLHCPTWSCQPWACQSFEDAQNIKCINTWGREKLKSIISYIDYILKWYSWYTGSAKMSLTVKSEYCTATINEQWWKSLHCISTVIKRRPHSVQPTLLSVQGAPHVPEQGKETCPCPGGQLLLLSKLAPEPPHSWLFLGHCFIICSVFFIMHHAT